MAAPPPLVILSAGSSGSHLLARLLGRHAGVRTGPEVALFHHRGLFDKSLYHATLYRGLTDRGDVPTRPTSAGPPFDLVPRRLIFHRDFYGCGQPDEELALLRETGDVVELASWIHGRCVERHGWEPDAMMIEHTPMSSMSAELLAEAFPDARFVHLVRDLRDAVTSMALRRQAGLLRSLPFEETLHLSAEQWCLLTTHARRAQDRAPDRFRLVRYEELVRRPEQVIAGLVTWLGLGDAQREPSEVETGIRQQDLWRNDPNGAPSTDSIGRHRASLSPQRVERLLSLRFEPVDGVDVIAPGEYQLAYEYELPEEEL